MHFDPTARRNWLSTGLSGGLIALLAILGLVLAVLQYRWTGELSRAEQARLNAVLQQSLQRLTNDLEADLGSAFAMLQPTAEEVAALGREGAYLARLSRWRSQSQDARLFGAIGLAIPDNGQVVLKRLGPADTFLTADWPESWSTLAEQLRQRAKGDRPPNGTGNALLHELPRFARPTREPDRKPGSPGIAEQDWLILEIDPAYLRELLLPRLIARHLSPGGGEPFQIEVYSGGTVAPFLRVGLAQGESIRGRAQASVRLFDSGRPPGGRWSGGGPSRGLRSPERLGSGGWQMYVNPPGGSLDSLVQRTRWRNLALALTLLLLIVATALLLVRSARQAQQLAELQMNFVSSVSHELRTPLTVIRTAAFNLRGRVAAQPEQVERYGKLIQEQSEKLGALVEQVLRYASTRAGQVIHEREAVLIDDIIEGGIQASHLALDTSPYRLEKHVPSDLPLVLADERALQHVVQNLLDNAVKYGTETSNWIGLSARQTGDFVELQIADEGPGIPAEEQAFIFEPFFRGRRAIADQIQGTGLGLNLVKKIVEAHGGTILVKDHAPRGAEFVVRIPVAPPEMQDEFAHSAG